MARPTGASPSTRTFLGAPPTPRFGVGEAKLQTPDANMRRGNDGGCLYGEFCSRRRPRRGPSCFEMHRSAAELGKHPYSLRAAMLLSMRAPRPIIRPCPRRPAKHHLRLYGMTAGAIPLFPDCYLQ